MGKANPDRNAKCLRVVVVVFVQREPGGTWHREGGGVIYGRFLG
jgi:hypothetical protein